MVEESWSPTIVGAAGPAIQKGISDLYTSGAILPGGICMVDISNAYGQHACAIVSLNGTNGYTGYFAAMLFNYYVSYFELYRLQDGKFQTTKTIQ